MARDRPGRPDPQGSRHFLDPAVGRHPMELRRSRRLRHRDPVYRTPRGLDRDRGVRRGAPFPRRLSGPARVRRQAARAVPEAAMRDRFPMVALILAVAAGAVDLAASSGGGRAAPIGASMVPVQRLADRSPNAVAVDVELVLAVDVSYSMD